MTEMQEEIGELKSQSLRTIEPEFAADARRIESTLP